MIDGFEHAVKLLASDNEDERIRAVEWLSDTADPKAAEAVRQIAFDFAEDDFVRQEAVLYFEAILDSGSVSEMLQDPSWVVREEAVLALGRMGAEHAAPLLRMALNDRKRHVRRSADKVLRAFGGRGSATDVKQSCAARIRSWGALGLLAAGLLATSHFVVEIVSFLSDGAGFGFEDEPSRLEQALVAGALVVAFSAVVAIFGLIVWAAMLTIRKRVEVTVRDLLVASLAGGVCAATGTLLSLIVVARIADGWSTGFPADPTEVALLLGFGCSLFSAVLAVRNRA